MIRVRRWLDSSKVREMCIRYNYYTRGDNTAYSNMLKTADDIDVDTDLQGVKQIAIDIIDHSDMASDNTSAYDYFYGDGYKEDIEGVMFALLSECTDMYVELDRSEV